MSRRVRLHDLHPPPDRIHDDVIRGLSSNPRSLPPKYFYDAAGARLFEQITTLEEYYPTRTELEILERHEEEMAAAIGAGVHLIEFGSGSGLKTRLLLRSLHSPAAYSAVDISRTQLIRFAADLSMEFPELQVMPVCADYTQSVTLPRPRTEARRRVAFFPGSSIGNFQPLEAAAFLQRVRTLCGDSGGLLIGVDLHKDTAVLERAYNDAAGVTADFNTNLLLRLNRDLGADFPPSAFRHQAFYDEEHQRIEMRLLCVQPCTVTIPDPDGGPRRAFTFERGDHITTEYSYKYSRDGFEQMAEGAGWRAAQFWTDARSWFGVWLLQAA